MKQEKNKLHAGHGLYLNHECDLLVLDKNNRFTEVEIKISMSDLKADFKKYHAHKAKYISRLVYAIPHDLLDKSMEPASIINKFYQLGCMRIWSLKSHNNRWKN